MSSSPGIQLSLLSPTENGGRASTLTGCWSAGEHYLVLGGRHTWVNVWFHFLDGEMAILSLRCLDKQPHRVHGRWWIDRDQLVVSFGESTIRAAYHLHEEVLQWAGEMMIRLPDQMASLPYGIKLPYHLAPAPLDQPATVPLAPPDFLVAAFPDRSTVADARTSH